MNGFKFLTIVLLASWLAGETRGDTLKIVATTSDLAAITRAVAGEQAEVYSICTGKEDPHMLQAKPGFILKARDADLWIRNGLELEIGWEPPILDGSRNPRIRPGSRGHLDASESVLVLDVPQTTVTRAMGDVHPLGNPHYWLDPLNGRRIAGAIAARLAEIAPAHASTFHRNAETFRKDLDRRMFGADLVAAVGADALWEKTQDGTIGTFLQDDTNQGKAGGWVAAMLPLRGQKIVTYHRSWIYFANRFGLTVAAELEPKPGVPPTAAHLSEVVDRMNAEQVRIILQEPFYSTRAAEKVASRTGARVVVVANSVGGESGATDYPSLIDLIVARIAGAE